MTATRISGPHYERDYAGGTVSAWKCGGGLRARARDCAALARHLPRLEYSGRTLRAAAAAAAAAAAKAAATAVAAAVATAAGDSAAAAAAAEAAVGGGPGMGKGRGRA